MKVLDKNGSVTRVVVIGAAGQFGTDLITVLNEAGGYEVVGLRHQEIECTDPASVEGRLKTALPDVVINCAAFVRVDEAENRPEESLRVNSLGAINVARACVAVDAMCVYVSTDYVFDGEKGSSYTESDCPCPINVYGVSKLAGEYLVQETCSRWLIARTASLFGKAGASGKGGNFVETVLAKAKAGDPLRLVDDIRMSPTYTRDAARSLEALLRERSQGIFHLVNAGHCTWYEFASKALSVMGLEHNIEAVSASEYPMKARRPKNSSLESAKLRAGPKQFLRPWEEALECYLREKGYLSS
jgi:dTDP-4-dehydrorhamnose reductase